MPARAVCLLWRGSTLLTQRPILTLNIPTLPLLGQLTKKTTAIAAAAVRLISARTSSSCNSDLIDINGQLSYQRYSLPISQSPLPLLHTQTSSMISKPTLPRTSTATRSFTTVSNNPEVNNNSSNPEVKTALAMKKCIVVGISGVTNGGKTTLCEQLERDMPMATHINMDHYFHDEESGKIPFIKELNHGNYEDPRAIDFDQMVVDVDKWVLEASNKTVNGHPQILFLEGILIFNHKPLVPYYSLKYFLTLTKDQCWDRRKHRSYDPPDPPGYFDLVVWPMYLKNKAQLRDQQDIVFLDGMEDQDKTYQRVLADLKAMVEET